MMKKFNTSFQNYPESHPLYRIHRPLGAGSVIARVFFLMLSVVTVGVMLIPSRRVRSCWALLLNLFTNHGETYKYYFKKAYNAVVLEITLPLIYFLLLMPYALWARLRPDKQKKMLPDNTDTESARYQS